MAMSEKVRREVEALVAAAVSAGGAAARQARVVKGLLKSARRRGASRQAAVADVQRTLWDEATGAPWRIEANTYVCCSHFNVRAMRASVCLERQVARWPGGNKLGDGSVRQKHAGIYPYCASGLCAEGAAYRAAMPPSYEPHLKSNPGHVFYKPDLNVQRQKRRTWLLSQPEGEVPDLDHPPGQEPRIDVDTTDEDILFILNGGGGEEG